MGERDGAPVPRVEPPWTLEGSGSILLFRFEPDFLERNAFLPETLRHDLAGRLGLVMLVDYRDSAVGPYWELLFLAGPILLDRRRVFSVTKIYVSSEASAVNGRENWGIPKEVADFEVDRRGRTERVIVTHGGRTVADLTLGFRRLSLPVSAAVLPRSWRTLLQPAQGRTFITTLEGRGTVHPATLLKARIDPELFPDLTQGRELAAVHASRFHLLFPPARIVTGED